MPELKKPINDVLALDPSAPAVEYHAVWRTWGRLSADADALQEALARYRLGAATRIGVILRNRPEIVSSILGIVRLEGCLASLNASAPDDRLASDIGAVKAPVLIAVASDWTRERVRKAAEDTGAVLLSLTDDPAAPVLELRPLRARPEDLSMTAPGIAIEMLSSGTTGAPKRIPLTAESLQKALQGAASYEKDRRPDEPARLRGGVQIVTAPLSHIAGITAVLNNVLAGRKICLIDKFAVDVFADAVRRHRPKVAGAPPAAIRMILDAEVPREDFSSLVAFRTGTAPLDPALADAFMERFGIPILQNYGATEFAGGAAGWTLDDFRLHWKDKRGSVGRLNPGTHGRIIDPDTGKTLSPGECGLLEIQAPNIGDGKSWVRTTDLAVVDADRFLWIKGRHDNAIIRGGFKILPDDVVRAIEQHPAIREAAVVGLVDARLGQVPAAAYILKAAAAEPSEAEMKEFLRDRLMPYQVPVRFLAVPELPRTSSMKASQPALRALFDG
jgi:acyl-CoA synthetase (AMP-forming)/AMP-acid ligase II